MAQLSGHYALREVAEGGLSGHYALHEEAEGGAKWTLRIARGSAEPRFWIA